MLHHPVRIGVIGCGGYAFQIINRIWTIPRFGTVAAVVCQPGDGLGADVCRERGIPSYGSVSQMLEAEASNLDAIVNPTPIHLHKSITLQCLQAGLPVFLEKPPVATIEDHIALIRASREAQLPIAIGFNSIYSYRTQQMKEELVSGQYGRVIRIRTVAAWMRPQSYFQRNDWAGQLRVGDRWVLDGTMNNPLAHSVASALYFASPDRHAMAEPSTVQAELYHANEIESEDTSSSRIITRDGVEIICNFTLCAEWLIERTTVIECENAVISIVEFQNSEISHSDGRHEIRETYTEDRIDMLQELCTSVRARSPFICDIASTLPFTRTVNAAFHSSWPIRKIPADYCSNVPDSSSTRTKIDSINSLLLEAHESGKLLSECKVPWAVAGDLISAAANPSVTSLSHAGKPNPAEKTIPDTVPA